MRTYVIAAAVGMTLALSACASSAGLLTKAVPIDPTSLKIGRGIPNLSLSPAAWPKADWWTSLDDVQLNGLITEALQDNPSLAEVDALAREAQAETLSADAARKPEVSAGGSAAEARLPTTLPIGSGHAGAAKYVYARFTWDIDLWGGRRAAWEAALGEQRAADIDAQAARIELSTNVARAYVQLGYAYAQQDVAIEELQRVTGVSRLAQQRVAAGIDSLVQLKQSDGEVATAQEKKAETDRFIDSARSALSVLLGKGPDRGLDITRPNLLPLTTLYVPSDLQAELLGHRADLVAARWRVEASEKGIKAAKTRFLPNINIGAMVGLIGLGGGNLFQAKSRFYEAAPAISLPIFDGGRLRANLSGKDADHDFAVARYNETLVQAVNEVSDDQDALDSLQLQIAAQQRALDAASDAWMLSVKRYKSGVGSYLEALQVRQDLLLSEERMASLHAKKIDFSIQLIQALGGGYSPSLHAPNVAGVAVNTMSHSLIKHS